MTARWRRDRVGWCRRFRSDPGWRGGFWRAGSSGRCEGADFGGAIAGIGGGLGRNGKNCPSVVLGSSTHRYGVNVLDLPASLAIGLQRGLVSGFVGARQVASEGFCMVRHAGGKADVGRAAIGGGLLD